MQRACGAHAEIAQRPDVAFYIIDSRARDHGVAAVGLDGAAAIVESVGVDADIASAPERAASIDDSAAGGERQRCEPLVPDGATAVVHAVRLHAQAVGRFDDAAAVVHQAVVGSDADAGARQQAGYFADSAVVDGGCAGDAQLVHGGERARAIGQDAGCHHDLAVAAQCAAVIDQAGAAQREHAAAGVGDGAAVVAQRRHGCQREVGGGNRYLASPVVQGLAHGEDCAAGFVGLIDQSLVIGQRGGAYFQAARADLAAAVVQRCCVHAGAGWQAGGACAQRAFHVGEQRTGLDGEPGVGSDGAAVVVQRGRAQLQGLLGGDGAVVGERRGGDHDVAVGTDSAAVVQRALQVGQGGAVDAEQAVSGMLDDAVVVDQVAGPDSERTGIAFNTAMLVVEPSGAGVDGGVAGAGLADQAILIAQTDASQADLLAGHRAGGIGPGSAGSAGQQAVSQQLAAAVVQPVGGIDR